MILKLFSSLVLLLSVITTVAPQTPDSQSALDQKQKEEKEIELKKELEQKTFALLEEVITGAATLRLPENRVIVQASAADLLWQRDEKRARALFKSALDNLIEAARQFTGKPSPEQTRAYFAHQQQRSELLQTVARRDPELALEMLRMSRTEPPLRQATSSQRFHEEASMEHALAMQVAATDPKRALRMAEESLSKGFSLEILNLLTRLNDKDKEMASRFASDIISKLRSENLSTNNEAAWFAIVMLRAGIQSEGEGASLQFGLGRGGRTQFILDDQQLRDLLDMVTVAALKDTPSPALFTFLPWLMPEIEKRLPERVPALRSKIAAVNRTLDPEQRMYAEHQELLRRGTIESLLEAAAKAPDKGREMLYEQAAWKAFNQGDAERARQIVNAHIRDTKSRERVLESFDRMALWAAISKENLEEARQKLPRIKSKEARAGVLTQMAFLAASKKDRKLALELLDEARSLINLKPKNDQQLYALLMVIRVYAMVEPIKAFEMIESLVDQANTLLAAASALSGFLLPSGTFKNGEMVMATGYSNVGMRFSHFGKELGALALVNFERTKAAADKFQRNEARVMARLFIAQAVLSQRLGSGVALHEGGVVISYEAK